MSSITSSEAAKAVVRRNTDEVQETARPDSREAHFAQPLPPIVRIVLTQAARHLMRGQITTVEFEAQVERLSREELEPRDLSVLVRDLRGETTRFIIKTTTTGQVWDMIETGLDDAPAGDSEALNSNTSDKKCL